MPFSVLSECSRAQVGGLPEFFSTGCLDGGE
jgi:hypothetical protein